MLRGTDYNVFVSYSRDDLLWRDRISHQLKQAAANRHARVFIDRDIPTGEDWKPALEQALAQTQVALFLVSKSWEQSTFCQVELQLILKRRETNKQEEKAETDDRGFPRVVWVSLDGITPETLREIQSVGDPDASLSQLRDDRQIDSRIARVCDEVLNQLDPLWGKLQSAIPAKYRLIRRLGEGSTSVVYLAGDLSLDRRVAMRAVRDPKDNLKFDAAVHRAAQIGRHRAILTVYGAWLDDDPHCCVFDYLDGESLRSHLDNPTLHWDARDVVGLLLRIGEALVDSHAQGVHHRDLRPSKILIDSNKRAFICGLSKPDIAVGEALLRGARPPTNHHLSHEQVHYLVPEHFYPLGEPETNEQSDQYLLGLIAWEVLTGESPRTLIAPEHVQHGEAPQFKPLTPLHELKNQPAGCPRSLSDAIGKMTNINPRNRYPHLADALDVLRDTQPVDLTLARESYARCTKYPERERQFIRSVYGKFRKRCPKGGKKFARFTPNRWDRLYDLLKEAVLLLFAYAGTPDSVRGEPNVLSRIAKFHGRDGSLELQANWFDEFASALVEAAVDVDPDCDEKARPFIEQAWRCSLEPGIHYMKSHCRRMSQPQSAVSSSETNPQQRLT